MRAPTAAIVTSLSIALQQPRVDESDELVECLAAPSESSTEQQLPETSEESERSRTKAYEVNEMPIFNIYACMNA